jgi:hypothetical protein
MDWLNHLVVAGVHVCGNARPPPQRVVGIEAGEGNDLAPERERLPRETDKVATNQADTRSFIARQTPARSLSRNMPSTA